MAYRTFIVGDWSLSLDKNHSQGEYEAACDAAVKKAYEFGKLPYHHCGFTESLSFAVPCEEVVEWGDLRLHTPVGEFVIKAKRARRGDPDGAVVVRPGLTAWGGVASKDSDSPPVSVYGRFSVEPDGELWFQVSSITYADGTHSGYLGSRIVVLGKTNAK